ncbi:GNAT family N-acetyltransferase [Pseudomonas sp. SP16.1]|uniref:GNAT family N-acetyltransferase n=1 Tax=Pseudomonas sp. SP16.1 TaxID=3458854 RepID=UPI0040465392
MSVPSIRTMTADELDLAIELAAQEGWNPGLHDAACFHRADPGGFLIAEVDGRPAGCISAVAYGADFGFIGLYIVLPEFRGQGIGMRLWQHGMQRLRGRVVGLDGVPAQQDNYRKSGFVLAWRNARCAGVARPLGRAPAAQIEAVSAADFAALCADDRRVFPAPREAFLHAWLAMPDGHALLWREAGRLAGWGVIRRCREGYKIGPLLADDGRVAAGLFDALCARVPAGEAVFLDVPLVNAGALELVRARGMQCVFETARMYAGPAPQIELAWVFGICTFELG